MTALILVVFLGAAVLAIPIAHALLVAAMAAAATSDRVPLDLLVAADGRAGAELSADRDPVLHAHRHA